MHRARRGDTPQAIGWNAALDLAADRLHAIAAAHGPDALGFYISGQLLTEDYYVFNKLAKGLLGTNNIDTNSRLCMSSAVAGYKATLGADAPPACYDDIAHADTLFIAGSNAAWAHPVLFRRIEDAKRARPQMRIVVVDPRRTETAEAADLHLPIAPGSDVALFNGMLHVMLWEAGPTPPGSRRTRRASRRCASVCASSRRGGGAAVRHRRGHAGAGRALVRRPRRGRPAPPDAVAVLPGPQPEPQRHAEERRADQPAPRDRADRPTRRRPVLADRPAQRDGRARGRRAREPAQRPPRPRRSGASRRGRPLVGRARRARRAGQECDRDVRGRGRRRNQGAVDRVHQPGPVDADQATVRRALQRAEFVVVQEAFQTTATCAYADLLLPASTWGEKTAPSPTASAASAGCVRRCRRPTRHATTGASPSTSRNGWRRGCGPASRRCSRTSVPSRSGTSTANRHAGATSTSPGSTTRGSRPRRRSGPSCRRRRRPRAPVRGRPLRDRRRPATFVDTPFELPAEPRDARYPFTLNTGRLRDQWHGMSRTGTLGRLFGHVAEPTIDLHPQDLERLRLVDGDLVHVSSRAAASCCRRMPARRSRRRRPSSRCTGAVNSSAAAAPTARRWPASTR
jgi:assimilatory nitrate reductase catalytic subunit